jgi:toxin ParE1/3/4
LTAIGIRYAARIEEQCKGIGNIPYSGRPRDDLAPDLRTVAFEESALICYVIEEEIVWITNIFRRGRDYEAILRGHSHSDAGD